MKVIALGFFDGVHLGHKALFTRTCEIAQTLDAQAAAFTFDSHPIDLLAGETVPLITDLRARKQLIRTVGGIDEIIVQAFDADFAALSWEQFVELLKNEYGAAHLVCGYDFRFGSGGVGDVTRLQKKCTELKLGLDVIAPVKIDDMPVCSTHIRKLLLAGKMEEAQIFLGHPHVLAGEVAPGNKLGRTLGAKTVNLRFGSGVIVLPKGVYATKVTLSDGTQYLAATAIGTRPTVEQAGELTVESHLLDFERDLYGEEICLSFYHYLRPEQKFESLEILGEQIQKDITEVRNIFHINQI